eukprot:3522989-Amphidinium_carterae.2
MKGSLYKAARINLGPATPEEEKPDMMLRNFAASLRRTDTIGLRKFHDVSQDTAPMLAAQHESVED